VATSLRAVLRRTFLFRFGMTYSAGGCVAPLIKSEAEVFKSHAVDKKTLAVVGSEDSYDLWSEVQDLLKFLLAFPKRLVGPFSFFNVEINSEGRAFFSPDSSRTHSLSTPLAFACLLCSSPDGWKEPSGAWVRRLNIWSLRLGRLPIQRPTSSRRCSGSLSTACGSSLHTRLRTNFPCILNCFRRSSRPRVREKGKNRSVNGDSQRNQDGWLLSGLASQHTRGANECSVLTLHCYTHSVNEDRMAAAGAMLTAIFSHAADRSGLKAD